MLAPTVRGRGSTDHEDGHAELLPIIHANGHAKYGGRYARGSRQTRRARQRLVLGLAAFFVVAFVTVQVWQLGAPWQQRPPDAGPRRSDRRLAQPRHPFPHLTHLVLVACHAVFVGFDYTKPDDPSQWFLLDYQKYPEYSHSFIEHIRIGIEEAAADPQALLLFSGGQTRKTAGPRSEGESYWLVAEAAGWYGKAAAVRERAFTEEHARDSFENLLFSVCRFYELTGQAPALITVVGYDFKRSRYSNLHRGALRYPADRFQYVGTPALTPGAEKGEAQAAACFERDPYGCTGELLSKKESRDPFAVGPYATDRCPPLEPLLEHCGADVFKGELPWDSFDALSL